jgi:2,3-bisphosphoglycerate-dependent phosphoglycerate mutase
MASTQIVFETHSWSADNSLGIATGWNHGALSPEGRALAEVLGERRRADGIDVVLVSDLRRAVETAEIALAGSDLLVLHDWRLRECNYGDLNGQPADVVHAAIDSVQDPYPGGESWAEAVSRVEQVIDDVATRWAGRRVLLIGHMSGHWALEHRLNGLPLESLGQSFAWQEGWEYELDA